MAEQKDIRVELLLEPVNVINQVGLRSKYGQDWKWVRGMIKHHLPILMARCQSDEDYAEVRFRLSMDGESVLRSYVVWLHEYNSSIAPYIDFLEKLDIVDVLTPKQ